MATYNSTLVNNKTPPSAGHGFYQLSTHAHATVALPATLATNDVANVCSLPVNAVVLGVNLKAQTQLDSSGSPALTFDVGITGTAQLFMAASALVGRSVGASYDTTMPGAGRLYKNTTGKDLPLIVTCHAGPATGVAGVLEFEISYFVEDTVGSPA